MNPLQCSQDIAYLSVKLLLLTAYRPVSTPPIFGKFLKKIIYVRLYSFLTTNGTLHKSQFGFRKGHSTSHALNYSIHQIQQALKQGHHVLGIFIDLSKAFDRNQLYVNFLGEFSHHLTVIFGVPQGCCLGLLLFLVYINDLSNAHKSTEFVLFADDTNIFVKAKNKALAYEKANTILEFFNLYMMTNKLHINISKSCFIDFKSENNSPLPNEELKVLIQNIEIKRVTEAKF